MKDGKVYQNILRLIGEKGGLAFIQFDPPKYSLEQAAQVAKAAERAGIDAFAVGGSVGAQGELLDKSIIALKENCSLPVIIFPGNIATVSKYADAIYFMSMLNSLDPYYISGAQIASSFPIKNLGLEPIPTSYIIVEPGRAVGWVGRAQAIPRNIPYLAAATALGGQFMGSRLVILESGGGADSPAPPEMVSLVKKTIDVPLIVAGGVRNPKFAYETIRAGADIIHVGSALEKVNGNVSQAEKTLSEIARAVAKAGKEKR
ncbi:MAG: geranylgeranylglyceryl/heptaprenylglyceryl phosphate synthase [Candidatus Diapherotrites archaeon]|nr:geranylgeranylglyceryl/heptaprenylglyceryl phosphate synthase [Candidatus Diapherotrites archaeon]